MYLTKKLQTLLLQLDYKRKKELDESNKTKINIWGEENHNFDNKDITLVAKMSVDFLILVIDVIYSMLVSRICALIS